jgi:hypothetical protein
VLARSDILSVVPGIPIAKLCTGTQLEWGPDSGKRIDITTLHQIETTRLTSTSCDKGGKMSMNIAASNLLHGAMIIAYKMMI